jgi:hypothetical protein
MKKAHYFNLFLLILPAVSLFILANSSGRSGYNSGSPGEFENDCTSCHDNQSDYGASLSINTDIPSAGYALSTEYNITVEMLNSTASRHGFQMVSERTSDHADVGTFVAGENSQLVDEDVHVTHVNAQRRKWSFAWISPASDQGPIKFYASGVAGMGYGRSQTQVVTTSSEASQFLSIETPELPKIQNYPNPVQNHFYVEVPQKYGPIQIECYTTDGRLVAKKKLNKEVNTINTSYWKSGVYQIKYTKGETTWSSTVLKE